MLLASGRHPTEGTCMWVCSCPCLCPGCLIHGFSSSNISQSFVPIVQFSIPKSDFLFLNSLAVLRHREESQALAQLAPGCCDTCVCDTRGSMLTIVGARMCAGASAHVCACTWRSEIHLGRCLSGAGHPAFFVWYTGEGVFRFYRVSLLLWLAM